MFLTCYKGGSAIEFIKRIPNFVFLLEGERLKLPIFSNFKKHIMLLTC